MKPGKTFASHVVVSLSKPGSLLLSRIHAYAGFKSDRKLHYGVVPFESLKEINLSKLLQLRTSFVKMSADANEDPVHFVTLAKNDTSDETVPHYLLHHIEITAQRTGLGNGACSSSLLPSNRVNLDCTPSFLPLRFSNQHSSTNF